MIKKENGITFVQIGNGDVNITSAAEIESGKPKGYITFGENGTGQIGEPVGTSWGQMLKHPVIIEVSDVSAIEVLIERAERTKEAMLELMGPVIG
jgi:hypothetical protein